TNISGNVIYDSGSLPIVGYDGTVYVVFEGSTRLATLNSQWIVKSTNGGVTWSRPVKIADVQDIITPAEAVFRVRSFPAGAAAPNGDLYVAWSTQVKDSDGTLCATSTNTGCHAAAVYSKSTDGGATWFRRHRSSRRSTPRTGRRSATRSRSPAGVRWRRRPPAAWT